MTDPGSGSTVLRRFAGPAAEELAILCRPSGGNPGTLSEQADEAYRNLATLLADHQASFGDLASETLFLRDVRRDLPSVLDARSRVLAELGQTDRAPQPGCIEQAPLDAGHVAFELAAAAIIPRRRDAWSVRDVRADPTCPCDGCARSGG